MGMTKVVASGLAGVLMAAVAGQASGEGNLVTAHSAFDEGSGTSVVTVHTGPNSAPADVVTSPDPQSLFGFSLSRTQDFNADGIVDLLVGSPRSHDAGEFSGSVHALSGSSGEFLFSYDGVSSGTLLGIELAGISDRDGDGVPDIAASGVHADGDGALFGRVFILSGADGQVLATYTGRATEAWFGATVAEVGDLDADGWQELAITERERRDGVAAAGRVLVFPGVDLSGSAEATYTDADAAMQLVNVDASVRTFALVLGSGIDVDEDGTPDVVTVSLLDAEGASGGVVTLSEAWSGADGARINWHEGVGLGVGGDADWSLHTNVSDFTIVASAFGDEADDASPYNGDLSENGVVDIEDAAGVITGFGDSSPLLEWSAAPTDQLVTMWLAHRRAWWWIEQAPVAAARSNRGARFGDPCGLTPIGGDPFDMINDFVDMITACLLQAPLTNDPVVGLACGAVPCSGNGGTGDDGDEDDDGIPDEEDCDSDDYEGDVATDCWCQDDDMDGVLNQNDCDSECAHENTECCEEYEPLIVVLSPRPDEDY